jgi:two-component system nitrate/nitrite response regulator NarL
MSLRVLLADDHVLVRQAIAAALRQKHLEVVGEASNGREAVEQCRLLQPQVAILDTSMPILSGIEATRELVRLCPNTRVLMLSDTIASAFVRESLQAGAKGYLPKTDTADELAEAIYMVSRGKTYVSRSVSPDWQNGDPRVEPLGPRERQVLYLIADGKRTKEIANTMGITCETVRSHRKHIMKKLDVRDTVELIRYSIDQGLLEACVDL